jgi:hypothetical protein
VERGLEGGIMIVGERLHSYERAFGKKVDSTQQATALAGTVPFLKRLARLVESTCF